MLSAIKKRAAYIRLALFEKPKIKLPVPHSLHGDRERDRTQQRLQLVQTKCHPYRDQRSYLGENVFRAGEQEFRLH
jgi:hypothetical protein